ncbi:MAG: methyltransferase domain-containing protein, partial [Lachnospiraceae bacterium]|nr:methyltransferase domain-containing protein [Lachnospiraceae bacterium]
MEEYRLLSEEELLDKLKVSREQVEQGKYRDADDVIADLKKTMMETDRNIDYYNQNAQSFYDNTVVADMSFWRDKFVALLQHGGRVLDAGCGSGRDAKAFIQLGFSVVAFDASRELCKLASELIDQEV